MAVPYSSRTATKHAGEQRRPAPADEEEQQAGRRGDRKPHDRRGMRPHYRAAREPTPRQVHEAMARRHEGEDPAAAVLVEVEDERSEDLPAVAMSTTAATCAPARPANGSTTNATPT
jgi:hypothetical protein